MTSKKTEAIKRTRRQLVAVDNNMAHLWWRYQFAEDNDKPVIERNIEFARQKREEICNRLTSLTSYIR